MALRLFDGFTGYAVAATDLPHRYTIEGASSNLLIEPAGGPFGLGGLVVGGNSRAQSGIYTTIPSAYEYIVGFWFDWRNFDATTDDYDSILIFGAGATVVAKLILTRYGALKVELDGYYIEYDSADAVANGVARYIYPGWTRIEFRFKSDSYDAEIEIRVNGVTWCSLTGIDGYGYAITRLTVGTALDSDDGSGAQYSIGGLYVLDKTGTFNNDFLHDWAVQVLRPTSDDSVQFDPGTNNYQNVDDSSVHDADATTNYTSVNAEIDTFGTSNTLTGSVCLVHAVNVCSMARCDDGQTQKARAKIKHSASTADGSDVTLNQTHWKSMIATFETCPSTSAQWTKAEVEAAKFGYESRA